MSQSGESAVKAAAFITLDDVLANEMGQFGWYQFRNIVLLALPIMVSAFKTDYIFSAAKIPHRYYIIIFDYMIDKL